MEYRECYEKGRLLLERAGVAEAALDARLLLEYVCGTNRNDLLVHGERRVGQEERGRYEALVEKRARRIPLQHLTGGQEFMGLEFSVNEHVLIPRQDTEILVEEALRELQDGMRILDMCTGSGCILVSLLHYSNGCTGIGADISEAALLAARDNASRLLAVKSGSAAESCDAAEAGSAAETCDAAEAGSAAESCDAAEAGAAGGEKKTAEFVRSDLFEEIEGTFDLIVSNPPYIRSEVIGTLMPEVKDHEPVTALDGHEDGLYFYRRIIRDGRAYLKPGGRLLLEIGFDQAAEVEKLLLAAGFREVRTVKDYAGLDRVAAAVKPVLE